MVPVIEECDMDTHPSEQTKETKTNLEEERLIKLTSMTEPMENEEVVDQALELPRKDETFRERETHMEKKMKRR